MYVWKISSLYPAVCICRLRFQYTRTANISHALIHSQKMDRNRQESGRQPFNNKFLLLAFGFFGLLNEKKPEEDESELIMTIKRSILLTQKGEYKKAEQMLHVALRQAQTLQHYDAITYIYDLLANLAFDMGDYGKAEPLFVSVMQRLISTGTPQNDLKIIHISLKVAKSFQHKGDVRKAEDGYKFCLKTLQEHIDSGTNNEDVMLLRAMTMDWYARFLLSQSRLTEAYKNFLQSYELSVQVNGKVHDQTVILLNDLGTVSSMLGNEDQALEYFTEAAEIGKNLPEMEDLGWIHINLGKLYIIKGLYDAAKKACEKGFLISKARNNEESLAEARNCLSEVKKILSK
ncbi:tetratricopeptide repeat protein 19 homolog, mitochondrial isoform X2 [Orussus abietinus]|uniref:tetratricopeptide repeat protein 19 homolog, mitochondrial isoform X2 n=1 Tax=Orussus abietinus TaxID=222816 RepID=UPI000626CD70|nr:tetratricopeptide repeat protein 19 homolog, mitochondrial isoform X2 [Orussus abietinus]